MVVTNDYSTILSTKNKRSTSSAQNCLPTSLKFSKGKTPKRNREKGYVGRKKVLCYTKSACEISDVLCTKSTAAVPKGFFFKTYFFSKVFVFLDTYTTIFAQSNFFSLLKKRKTVTTMYLLSYVLI